MVKDGTVNEALETLKLAGYKVTTRTLAKFKSREFRLNRKDIKKFKKWAEWAVQTKGKFIVAYAGVDHKSFTFHSVNGYEGRKKHATDMRKKIETKETNHV